MLTVLISAQVNVTIWKENGKWGGVTTTAVW